MSLSCFISHNASEEERVFVYRLQTLATSSGMKVMLPHRVGRLLSDETRSRIERADLVIAFLTASRATQVHQELGFAQALGKPILAIKRKGAKPPVTKGIRWIEYDERRGLATIESKVLDVLHEKLSDKQAQQGAVVAILGITLLALLSQQTAKK